MFINLIDNAIEACEGLAKENRFINIEAMVKANYLIIKVENSKSNEVNLTKKKIQTFKKKRSNHGLGLQIIDRTCKQNEGSFKIVDSGAKVEMFATLLMEEQHA